MVHTRRRIDYHSTMGDRIYLFDTTLRDGAQTYGVDFTVADKLAIAEALDQLGVDYIEGGWPGANPTDTEFFAQPPELSNATLVAFGMTRRPGRSAHNDPVLAALLNAAVPATCLVGKAWDFHVDAALEIPRQENLDMIRDSIVLCNERKRESMFDAEHFFDGYRANPEYALNCLRAAHDAGARWLVLCDTNGGTLPHEVERIVTEVCAVIPGDRIGIHAHNDTGNAIANSLAAVRAGARQVQGTVNGLGERCGNADLIALIPTLILKMEYVTQLDDCALKHLSWISHFLDERLNRPSDPHAPYVGTAAFAHKGGLHVSAVQKSPRTYEHIDPELVGNRRHIVVSDQAGRANVITRLDDLGIAYSDDKLTHLLEAVKQKEFEGYAYEGAAASFELLAREILHGVPTFFELRRFRVMDEHRHNAQGQLVTESEATVTVRVANQEVMRVAMGNGPVNALDKALRAALISCFPQLEDMHLVDYKVRIMQPGPDSTGTDAITRVLIECENKQHQRWSTIGVSGNIIDASYTALYDAYRFILIEKIH